MNHQFQCPQCQKQFRTAGDTAGKKAKCSQCGAVFVIPASTATAQATQGSVVPRIPIATVPPPPSRSPATVPDSPRRPAPVSPPLPPPSVELDFYLPNRFLDDELLDVPAPSPDRSLLSTAFDADSPPPPTSLVRPSLVAARGIGRREVSVRAIYAETFNLFLKNLPACIASVLVSALFIGFMGIMAAFGTAQIGAFVARIAGAIGGRAIAFIASVAVLVTIVLVICFVLGLGLAGLVRFYLSMVRGKPSFGHITDGGEWAYRTGVYLSFVALVVSVFVFGLLQTGLVARASDANAVGALLGTVLMLLGWAGPFYIVDREHTAQQALVRSVRLSLAHRATISSVILIWNAASFALSFPLEAWADSFAPRSAGLLWSSMFTLAVQLGLVAPFQILLLSVMYVTLTDRSGQSE